MKKLRLVLTIVWLLAFGLITFQANAQQKRRGTPPSFLQKEVRAIPAKAHVKMPVNFTISELLTEDEQNVGKLIPLRVAKDIPANLTMENSGVWSELPDGRKIWQLAVEAKTAKAIILSYDGFYLPAGSQLFIYNADKTHVLGAFDNTDNADGGRYSTPFIAGDVIILEYVAPAVPTRDKPIISIEAIGFGYNHIHIVPSPEYTSPGASNECQVNVVCIPEGFGRENQSKSVCQMTMRFPEGWGLCTGTLINNTSRDGAAYIITADHCIIGYSSSMLDQWQFNFFYESDDCLTNSNWYDRLESLVGAKAVVEDISIGGGSDGALLELLDQNRITLVDWALQDKIQYAAWRRTVPPATTKGFGIHHPAGDMKKILNYDGITLSTWNGSGYTGAVDAHITINPLSLSSNGWSQTEGGSSGSGLFDDDGYLIGTLTGGSAANCSSGSDARYGGLFYHWNHGINGGMGGFLDPVGGGTATECTSWPIGVVCDFAGFPRNIYALQTAAFIPMTPGIDSLFWEFEGGIPAATDERNPIVTYNTEGDFDVKLTLHYTDSQGQDSIEVLEKFDYIKVRIKCGVDAGEPVANFIAYTFDVIDTLSYDNGNRATGLINANPPNVLRNGASGSATATYLKEALPLDGSESFGTVFSNANVEATGNSSPNCWVRRSNAITNNANYGPIPVSNGFSGAGDFYYAFYQNTNYMAGALLCSFSQALCSLKIGQKVRMYNREPIDLSGTGAVGDSVIVKFKLLRKQCPDPLAGALIGQTPYFADGLMVQYRSAPTDQWTTIYTLAKRIDAAYQQWDCKWLDYSISLPNRSATYQIAFVAIAGNGYGMALDEIEILEYEGEVASHVTVWEGDRVKYFDLAEGCPVFYEYEFEEGTPATSKTDAPSQFIQYNVANVTDMTYYNPDNDYYAKQWVKNTFGEDDFTLEHYVTVMGRILEIDKKEVIAECNYISTDTVTITTNKNWVVANKPAWVTINPSSGTVESRGTNQDFKVGVTTALNTSPDARIGNIVFTTDDGKVSKVVTVKQATPGPAIVKVDAVPDNNAEITWNRLNGMSWPILQSMRIPETQSITEATIIKDTEQFDFEMLGIDPLEIEALGISPLDLKSFDFKSLDLKPFDLNLTASRVINDNKSQIQRQPALQSGAILQSLNVTDLVEITQSNWEPSGSGVQAGGTGFGVAHFWTAAEMKPYKDYEIKGIRMVAGHASADYTVFVIEATGTGTSRVYNTVYSEHIGKLPVPSGATLIESQLDTIIELDYPVIITGNTDMYIGYSFEDGYQGAPTRTDNMDTNLPNASGKGNMLYYGGAWQTLLQANAELLGNWLLSAYIEKPIVPGFSVYRQRMFDGVPTEPAVRLATGLTDTTYLDEGIRPGGEYCYWVTYTHLNMESCPGTTGCVFIVYSQDILGDIDKEYGDLPRTFNVYNYISSSADTVDYFKERGVKMPVKLEPYSGDLGVLTLSGAEGNYNAYIEKAGTIVFRATQEGKTDTLLPADTVYITATIHKHDLYVIGVDEWRKEGTPNTLALAYDNFVYNETVANLDRKPDVTTSATLLSPIGDYGIVVTVYPDKNYNTMARNGVLNITRDENKVNAFTPNDDNFNDHFMAGYKIKVFNRYGALVYETESVTQKLLGWDGTFKKNNRKVDPGVYYYVAYDDNGKVVRTGSVAVLKD